MQYNPIPFGKKGAPVDEGHPPLHSLTPAATDSQPAAAVAAVWAPNRTLSLIPYPTTPLVALHSHSLSYSSDSCSSSLQLWWWTAGGAGAAACVRVPACWRAAPAARRMATHMYGGATVACRVCYRDQHGTPPRELGCNTPRRGKGMSGHRAISRLCQWKPTGRRSDADARRGCEVRCRSCGSRNGGKTTECESSEDGASPYR
ncbi:hypothetical protein PVAP13_8NG310800 [Panicum virgatum]|uniref:Uncharacterized protein n=1 Tax=Panicum virgatum TaxID=38727 RepID=A0A8T0PGM5_PANVG|nr:hypothetical protein PVAP13_8NG310800 [Panicum virgatum]